MYNRDMPKLNYTKDSIGAIVKKAEEGIVLTKKEQEAYQFIVITSKQMQVAADTVRELARSYEEAAKSVTGMIHEIIKQQQRFAKQLQELFESVAVFRQINVLIQIPRLIVPPIVFQPQLVRIFVQPNEPYVVSKPLSSPKRKYNLPLTSVKIENNGFIVDGEYIRGMTRKSKPGKVFELMIRADLKGVVPDNLIDQVIGTGYLQSDYEARDLVIRDLKKILLFGNKIKLNLTRYSGIGKYKVAPLTHYIRKPKKVKRIDKTRKTN